MKKTLAILVALIMVVSASAFAAEIKPLYSIEENTAPTDAMINVSFNCKAGDVTEKSIKVSMYEEILFDAVEVNSLAVGDTINVGRMFENRLADVNTPTEQPTIITIETIETAEDGTKLINGGIENNGINLIPGEGGTYFCSSFVGMNDYEYRGVAEYEFAETVKCVMITESAEAGENSESYSQEITSGTTAAENIASVLAEYQGENDYVDYREVSLLIEGGKVTTITIEYIP